jgi:hypothetical protein
VELIGVKKHMGKKSSSASQSGKRIAQRARTQKNKEKKYNKLIAERPNDIHVATWKKKIS